MHFASRHVGHDEGTQACAALKVIATCSQMLRSLLPHTMKSAEYVPYGGQPFAINDCRHASLSTLTRTSNVGKEMSRQSQARCDIVERNEICIMCMSCDSHFFSFLLQPLQVTAKPDETPTPPPRGPGSRHLSLRYSYLLQRIVGFVWP